MVGGGDVAGVVAGVAALMGAEVVAGVDTLAGLVVTGTGVGAGPGAWPTLTTCQTPPKLEMPSP
jgi:hypothetical protein